MAVKHGGWTVKNCMGRNPWLVFGFAFRTRHEAIEAFELLQEKGNWQKEGRKGNFKLVKVKLVEVE